VYTTRELEKCRTSIRRRDLENSVIGIRDDDDASINDYTRFPVRLIDIHRSIHLTDTETTLVEERESSILLHPDGSVAHIYLSPCTRDDCKGVFSNKDGHCMVCAAEHCVACRCSISLDDGVQVPHVCMAEDIATAKFIATTTKACPQCKVPIIRSSGCNQMMCTSCHCVFDWSTGKEVRGAIFSPYRPWITTYNLVIWDVGGGSDAAPTRAQVSCTIPTSTSSRRRRASA